MRRHRFHVHGLPGRDATVRLPAEESDHLARVLRLRPGDEIYLFDGEGAEVRAVVTRVGRSGSEARIGDPLDDTVESPLPTTLVQSLAAGDRLEVVVRRSTELGVTRIVLLRASRTGSSGRPFAPGRLGRLRRVALEAAKQCGRRRVPEVTEPVGPGEWPRVPGGGLALLLDPVGGASLAARLEEARPPEGVALAVGPEGGWSDEDRAAAAAAGYQPVRLGPRLLRTETAGPAALALVQAAWGDLR